MELLTHSCYNEILKKYTTHVDLCNLIDFLKSESNKFPDKKIVDIINSLEWVLSLDSLRINILNKKESV
jgi:hypothetical protein